MSGSSGSIGETSDASDCAAALVSAGKTSLDEARTPDKSAKHRTVVNLTEAISAPEPRCSALQFKQQTTLPAVHAFKVLWLHLSVRPLNNVSTIARRLAAQDLHLKHVTVPAAAMEHDVEAGVRRFG